MTTGPAEPTAFFVNENSNGDDGKPDAARSSLWTKIVSLQEEYPAVASAAPFNFINEN